MSFYICHCGQPETNHDFLRHTFSKTAVVKRDLDEKMNEYFIIDINDFPLKEKDKCEKSNCVAGEKIHNTELVNHKYVPIKFTYRKAIFSIPYDALCNAQGCGKIFGMHNVKHKFQTSIKFLNKIENDIIIITDPDGDEISIDFNS